MYADEPVVVVGVDGAGPSVEALRFALLEALHRGVAVKMVTAWSADDCGGVDNSLSLTETIQHRIRRLQDAALADALTACPEAPAIVQVAVEAEPADALVRAAESAAMLVLGHRQEPQVGTKLVTTAAQCLRRAACPVVLVPAPAPKPGPSPEHQVRSLP